MSRFDFFLDEKDPRKKEFVAVRMERDLFQDLSRKAQEQNSDLSSVIRSLCRAGLRA